MGLFGLLFSGGCGLALLPLAVLGARLLPTLFRRFLSEGFQIIAAPKKLDETGIGSRACKAEVEVEESF